MVSGAPQGLVSELILITVYVKNSGTEWTLSLFTGNTRVVNLLESMAVTQGKLYMMDKWPGSIFM